MNHRNFSVKTEEGIYDLEASGQWIGPDLLVAIWGGEKPHIGAVAVAQPRPSLKNPEFIGATVSVFCYSGHKEDELAKAAAEILAAALNAHVVVTAGIHWNDLSAEGIRQVIKNSEILLERILAEISEDSAPFTRTKR